MAPVGSAERGFVDPPLCFLVLLRHWRSFCGSAKGWGDLGERMVYVSRARVRLHLGVGRILQTVRGSAVNISSYRTSASRRTRFPEIVADGAAFIFAFLRWQGRADNTTDSKPALTVQAPRSTTNFLNTLPIKKA